MTQHRDPDAIIAAWLEDGPDRLPLDTRRAIAVGVRTQPRARRMAIPGGSSMIPITRLVAALAFLVVAGLGAALLLANRSGEPAAPSSPPSPSATIAPTQSGPSASTPSAAASRSERSGPPSPTPFTAPTVFVSPTYGYAVTLPAGWLATPASIRWDGTTAPGYDSPLVDVWVAPHVQNRCRQVFVCAPSLWAYAATTDLTLEPWVALQDAAAQRDHPCGIPVSRTTIRIDGQAAILEDGHCGTDGPFLLIAYTVRDGTGYAFLLQDNAKEAPVEDLDRSEFASILATIKLGS